MFGIDLPSLTTGNHTTTSPATTRYNCVAFSIHDDLVSLWPDDDNRWPETVPRQETIRAFELFFLQLKFIRVSLDNTHYEDGYEKVALYADQGVPQHVARQIGDGRWKSKLGELADIEHRDLAALEGGQYGYVVAIFRRKFNGAPPALPPLIPPRPLIIMP